MSEKKNKAVLLATHILKQNMDPDEPDYDFAYDLDAKLPKVASEIIEDIADEQNIPWRMQKNNEVNLYKQAPEVAAALQHVVDGQPPTPLIKKNLQTGYRLLMQLMQTQETLTKESVANRDGETTEFAHLIEAAGGSAEAYRKTAAASAASDIGLLNTYKIIKSNYEKLLTQLGIEVPDLGRER